MQRQPEPVEDGLQLQQEPNEDGLEEWGDDSLVYHETEGVWIMYDPESDTVDLDDMR